MIVTGWNPAAPPWPVPGLVHVWHANLDAPNGAVPAWLSDDEQRRARQFAREPLRQRFTAARCVLRRVLGQYLREEPAQLRFTYGRFGKPELAPPWIESGLRFNLSHTAGTAILGVSCCELGVDIEQIRPRSTAAELVGRYFAASERAEFERVPADRQLEAFLLGWTRKEAFVKALGDGLQCPLDSFAVTLAPDLVPRLTLPAAFAHERPPWLLHDLRPDANHIAAVVGRGIERTLLLRLEC